jgi:hypothetical protein
MHWFWRGLIAAASIGFFFGLVAGRNYPKDILGIGLPVFALAALSLLFYGFLTALLPSANSELLDSETRCRKCGYLLRGITEPRCPECGERI